MKHFLPLLITLSLLSTGFSTSSFMPLTESPINYEEQVDKECQLALEETTLNVDTSKIVADLRLPLTGLYSTTISWTSSNTTLVAINSQTGIAKVTRPAVDTSVTLSAKATRTYQSTSYEASKDYPITILKKTSGSSEDLPLAFSEDFSSYLPDIDLSNYQKWQLAKGDSGRVQVIHKDEFPNINNMVSASALQVISKRAINDTYYEANINLSSSTSASALGIFEGYFLYSGETNGLALEFISGSNVIAGFKVSSDGYSFYKDGAYYAVSSVKPVEGVWQKFRMSVRTSGYLMLELYSYQDSAYVDLTKDASTGYITGAGVSSGFKGNATKLRIHTFSGKKNGATYLSNLQLDSLENLPVGASVTNYNRPYGIGEISGYESSILSLQGATIEGVDPKNFIVKNRFVSDETYVYGTDYSVTTVSSPSEDGSTITYRHTFTLKKSMSGVSTPETKTIVQTVMIDQENNPANVTNFKASYLKASSTTGLGYITISGNVIRDDSTFYYVVLPKGSATPSANEVVSPSALSGLVDSGSILAKTASFSINTKDIDMTKSYDIYGVTKNTHGLSPLYSALSVSTKVNISSCQDLYDITYNKETASSECVLINDLDFSEFEWNYDTTGNLKFAGTLDGQGHTIKNLSFSTPVTTAKVGLFANLSGTVKNLKFVDADVAGYTDVGLIAGNLYDKATISNIEIVSCQVRQDSTVSGGDGYFGLIGGRVRSGGDVTITNINASNSSIDCSQRVGLLVGGVGDSNDNASLTVKNVYLNGSINTDNGASVGGVVGRNRGSVTIDNAVVFLHVYNAKKEVAAFVGKHEKGTLSVTNGFGDLKIDMIAQTNYFNNFIGTVTPSLATYSASNITFLNEDYSNLGDAIVPNVNAINLGNHVEAPSEYTAKWWEENTFIRDFNISTIWAYSETSTMPYISLRETSSFAFTAADFTALVAQIDTSKILANHYYIYKALDVYPYLSAATKEALSTQYQKLLEAKALYEQALSDITTIVSSNNGTSQEGGK